MQSLTLGLQDSPAIAEYLLQKKSDNNPAFTPQAIKAARVSQQDGITELAFTRAFAPANGEVVGWQ